MPSSDDLVLDTSISLLLQGVPKSGKTVLALHFPQPYVLDCDNNLSGPVRYFRSRDIPLKFDYDTVALKDGKAVPIQDQWKRGTDLLKAAYMSGKYKTLIVDSATALGEMLCHHIMNLEKPGDYQVGKMKMTYPLFGDFKQLMMKFLVTFTKLPDCHFVFLCHEEPEKDEMDGVLHYRPAIVGSLKHNAGAMFTDVWRTEIERIGDTFSYKVRTMPGPRVTLGNSLGLPPLFPFDWQVVADRLGKIIPIAKAATQKH